MTEKIKERRPTVAALLSLVLMGLGQLYNGQLRRAVVLFAIEIFGYAVTAMISAPLLSFHGIMIIYFGALMFVGIRIFAVIDAFIGARRIGEVELHRYNRWYVYMSILLVTIIIPVVFESPIVSYSIPSGSMQPSLLVGDYVFSDRNAFHDRAPERSDVVVYKLPQINDIEFINRVIGLPGDQVQVRGGILHINGEAVKREVVDETIVELALGMQAGAREYIETLPGGDRHRIWEWSDHEFLDNTPLFTVPQGHIFIMGDNRDNSIDSRVMDRVGFVPTINLVGRVEVVYFSQNATTSWWKIWHWPQAIRFNRIGKEIE